MGRARRAGPARLEKEAGWAENCNPQPVLTHPVWPAGLVGCRRAGAGQPASQQLKKKKKANTGQNDAGRIAQNWLMAQIA